jgi:hypothetical protein
MQETEQILVEYSNGTRTATPFANAREMFAAMDAEDKLDHDEKQIHP